MESVQPNPSSCAQNPYLSSKTLASTSQNQYTSFQTQSIYYQNQANLASNHHDHPPVPETLASFSKHPQPPTTETLVSNYQNQFSPSSDALPSENLLTHQESKTENQNKTLVSENAVKNATHSGTDRDCSGDEEETSSRRKRCSTWDPPEKGDAGGGTRRRKSRWADDEPKPVIQLPDFMKDIADDCPEGARSPSPEPIYDNIGIQINTREYRAREKLNKEKLDIISQLMKRNPMFKPPTDYRPPKLHKKLYIPMKEYPGYNFIGLIIGPRGNTQKRMEEEMGAKIVIRGKGSIKEGRLQQKRDSKPDPSENEDLHILVEAETQEALEAAAGMLEKLLQPVYEVLNEHKRLQLRELAALNGTIRDEQYCRSCGELGHRQYACPTRTSTFKSDVLCKICGDGGPTIDCPVKGTTRKKMDDKYQNFLAELRGSVPESMTKQNSSVPLLGSSSTGSVPSSSMRFYWSCCQPDAFLFYDYNILEVSDSHL